MHIFTPVVAALAALAPSPDPQPLERIVVTAVASRVPQAADASPATLSVLTREERERGAVTVVLRSDAVADEIVSYARSSGVDLIVMGTHGRSGVARLLTGSIAERVVRTAPCMVVTSRELMTKAA